ncbi:MAG: hypothetical protein FJW35_17825 [Acidobacteria bacterium]|nr:hypothetical protein [Acidobacteriota bacterium]
MVCSSCQTLILPEDFFCRKCGAPVTRQRAGAIDYGRMGRRPADAVPVPTGRGAIWEPQGVSDAELQQREFMARRPPPIAPPPRGGRVKFHGTTQVNFVENGGEATAARRGDYQAYCPRCDSDEPLQQVGRQRICPGCKRVFGRR